MAADMARSAWMALRGRGSLTSNRSWLESRSSLHCSQSFSACSTATMAALDCAGISISWRTWVEEGGGGWRGGGKINKVGQRKQWVKMVTSVTCCSCCSCCCSVLTKMALRLAKIGLAFCFNVNGMPGSSPLSKPAAVFKDVSRAVKSQDTTSQVSRP